MQSVHRSTNLLSTKKNLGYSPRYIEELNTEITIAEHGDDPNYLSDPLARTKSETFVWKCRSLEISVPCTTDNEGNEIPRPQGRMSVNEI